MIHNNVSFLEISKFLDKLQVQFKINAHTPMEPKYDAFCTNNEVSVHIFV